MGFGEISGWDLMKDLEDFLVIKLGFWKFWILGFLGIFDRV